MDARMHGCTDARMHGSIHASSSYRIVRSGLFHITVMLASLVQKLKFKNTDSLS